MEISIKILIIFISLQVSQSHRLSTRISEILKDSLRKLTEEITVELNYDNRAKKNEEMKVQEELNKMRAEFPKFINPEQLIEKSTKAILDHISPEFIGSLLQTMLIKPKGSKPKSSEKKSKDFEGEMEKGFKEFNTLELVKDPEPNRKTSKPTDNFKEHSKNKDVNEDLKVDKMEL